MTKRKTGKNSRTDGKKGPPFKCGISGCYVTRHTQRGIKGHQQSGCRGRVPRSRGRLVGRPFQGGSQN